MAAVSLKPGEQWSQKILSNLRNSSWVIVLVSRAACASSYVNQEIGGALLTSKNLIPIMWDMSPQELPGWLRDYQAIDLRGTSIEALKQQIEEIAARIKQKKTDGWLIIGAIVLCLLILGRHT